MFPQARSPQSRRVPGGRRLARGAQAPCSRHRGCSRSSARRDRRTSRAISAERIQLQNILMKLTNFAKKITLALKVWSF